MFCKRDLVVVIAAAIVIAVSAIAAAFYQKNEGDTLRITIDGELYGEYSLADNQTVTMTEKLGYNRLVIENGTAYMADADCADKYCMAYKPISPRWTRLRRRRCMRTLIRWFRTRRQSIFPTA